MMKKKWKNENEIVFVFSIFCLSKDLNKKWAGKWIKSQIWVTTCKQKKYFLRFSICISWRIFEGMGKVWSLGYGIERRVRTKTSKLSAEPWNREICFWGINVWEKRKNPQSSSTPTRKFGSQFQKFPGTVNWSWIFHVQ